jgi:hypothetical protein
MDEGQCERVDLLHEVVVDDVVELDAKLRMRSAELIDALRGPGFHLVG